MKKCLIINADDFGLHEDINKGIEKAIQFGTVKSTSFIVNTPAFDSSVEIIRKYPEVSVGVHLNLTDGRPLTSFDSGKALLNKEGCFLNSHLRLVRAILNYPEVLGAIYEEFQAQIIKLSDKGVKITHLDSHGHVHILPNLLKISLDLAKKFQIPFVRVPKEEFFSVKVIILNILSNLALPKLKKEGLKTTDYFLGVAGAGKFTKEKLLGLVSRIHYGLTELVVHPGLDTNRLLKYLQWGYSREDELAALTDKKIKEEFSKNGIILSDFWR